MSSLPGETEGFPPAVGRNGSAGPSTLPAWECPLQPDYYVWAGVISQYAEEAGTSRGCSYQRGWQL